MERTNAWELADRCNSSLATVVFHMVNLGVWSPDAAVDFNVGETICALVKDPDARNRRVVTSQAPNPSDVARAILDRGALERATSHEEIAAVVGAPVDAVIPIVAELAQHNLIRIAEGSRVEVSAAMVRPLSAIADGSMSLDDVAS